MRHKCTYTVTTTCQGQVTDEKRFDSLVKAVVYYAKEVHKYGRYGTMNFQLYAI